MSSNDPPFEYPRKIVSGAVLFLDDAGRLLIVNPTYKQRWEIPGGLAEQGESPAVAARREILEELALDRVPGRLLCVEWRPPIPRGVGAGLDGLHFIFEGGMLTTEEIASIRLPADELAGYAFCELDEALERLPSRLAARVSAAMAVAPDDAPVYLEAGVVHGSTSPTGPLSPSEEKTTQRESGGSR